MKISVSPRILFIAGFVILIVTNIVVLSGVAVNRFGTPETQIILTERELRLPSRVHVENSGLDLRLNWRTLSKNENNNGFNHGGSTAWFDAEKLAELGFNIGNDLRLQRDNFFYRQTIPKEVYIVLESDGESYREAVKRAESALERERGLFNLDNEDKHLRENFERAEKRVKQERIVASRLFAIDAGLNPQTLREKYHDRTRFIITRGLVKPGYNGNKKEKKVYGYITKLSIENIHVSRKHRKLFDPILEQGKSEHHQFRAPRYEVKLAYGHRFEPWIVSVQQVEEKSD